MKSWIRGTCVCVCVCACVHACVRALVWTGIFTLSKLSFSTFWSRCRIRIFLKTKYTEFRQMTAALYSPKPVPGAMPWAITPKVVGIPLWIFRTREKSHIIIFQISCNRNRISANSGSRVFGMLRYFLVPLGWSLELCLYSYIFVYLFSKMIYIILK